MMTRSTNESPIEDLSSPQWRDDSNILDNMVFSISEAGNKGKKKIGLKESYWTSLIIIFIFIFIL